MSTELAIQNDLGMSLAEAIGVTSSGGETKSVSLPRVNLIHNGIMGNIEVNGKTVKTEVVPAGSYKITQGEDNVVYSVNPSIRIFAVRQQWSKWDSAEEKMMKGVQAERQQTEKAGKAVVDSTNQQAQQLSQLLREERTMVAEMLQYLNRDREDRATRQERIRDFVSKNGTPETQEFLNGI